MAAPPGFVPEGFEPEATPSSAPPVTPAGPSNLIAQWKQALTSDRPRSQTTMFGETDIPGRVVRQVGKAVLPESWPGAIGMGVSMIPGGGFLAGAGRTAGSALLSGLVEKLRGADPVSGMAQGAGQQLIGETLGGVGRAMGREVQALRDAGYTKKVASAIESILPVIKGKTPEHTISNLVSGEAQKALSESYEAARADIYRRFGDPTILLPPRLARALGITISRQGVAAAPASEVQTAIESLSRSITGVTGATSRRKSALTDIMFLNRAKEIWDQGVRREWPPAAFDALTAADKEYGRGKALMRLFGAGKEQTGESRIEKLIQPTGDINREALQTSFLGRLADLRRRLTPEDLSIIESAIRRGEPSPLVRDIPGRGVGVGAHVTPYGANAYLRHLPRVPRLIGAPTVTPEDVSRAMRELGVRGTEAVTQ